MKSFVLFVILMSRLCAVTPNEIIDLTKLEHSREDLLSELEIYSEAREFLVNYEIVFPAESKQPDPVIVKEKTVKGKYIVSEFSVGPEENRMDLVMVVTYSKKLKSYQKWLLNITTKELQEFVGVKIHNSNSISWTRIDAGLGEIVMIMGENFKDSSVSWTESYYEDGDLKFLLSGVANKTR